MSALPLTRQNPRPVHAANWQVRVNQLAGACMNICQHMPDRLFMSLNAAADSHLS